MPNIDLYEVPLLEEVSPHWCELVPAVRAPELSSNGASSSRTSHPNSLHFRLKPADSVPNSAGIHLSTY
jgi:hypothetical protein